MLSIFVPALNEEKNIQSTIDNLINISSKTNVEIEIIVCNDGSTDRTYEILLEKQNILSNLRIINNQKNLGIGASFKKALKIAKYEKIMIAPGDNDANYDLLVTIFNNVEKSDMITSYYLNKEMRGRFRNLVSTLFHSLYILTFDIFLMYMNGPTIYPTKILKTFKIHSDRFSIVSELTTKCLRSEITYMEIAGKMNTGVNNSSALNIKNLVEVIVVYVKIFFEIYFKAKKDFSVRATRNYQ